MSDLERLELILRRLASKRDEDNKTKGKYLNVDIQDFIADLVEELAKSNKK